MLFSSLEFLFFFLPICIGGYYLLPRRLKNAWLLAASLFFYAWGEPTFVAVMVASIVMNYLLALVIASSRLPQFWRRLALQGGIVMNLALIFVYKYANFAIGILREAFPSLQGAIPQTSILLPIGISFFTFQALSYLVDVYRGIPAQKNPVNLALYIALFPQLIAGPIVRYNTVAEQIVSRHESFDKFASGIGRFLIGFNKKMLLANFFAITADRFFAAKGLSVCGAWLGAIAYTFQIFFDFSGYSDMAIGLGRMFGFEFLENFNYPYISRSITEFWRRWHMSLGSWFRDYLYFPLGGSRVDKRSRLVFNLSVVWLATGVWHGANWTFILWGVLYGVLIIGEKLSGWPKLVERRRIFSVFGWFATMLFVVLGWVLFRAPDLASAGRYLAAMFGGGAGFCDYAAVFEFMELRVLLPVAILASIPWAGRLPAWARAPWWLLQAVLFLGGISCLVMSAHNPFIYFNF